MPDKVSEAMIRLLTEPAVTVATVGTVLKRSKNAAYADRRSGDIPSFRVGREFRVPSEAILDRLGLSTAEARKAALRRLQGEQAA